MQSAHALPIPSGHPSGVFDAVKAVWTGYRRDAVKRREVRTAIQELNRLDDRSLADIGIGRSQIADAVVTGWR